MNTIVLFLDHSADIRQLREVFIELAKNDEGVIDYHTLAASVTQHSRAGQELSFYAMSPDPSTAWATAMRLREAMLDHVRNHHPDWWPYERLDGPHIEPQLTAMKPHLDTKSDD